MDYSESVFCTLMCPLLDGYVEMENVDNVNIRH